MAIRKSQALYVGAPGKPGMYRATVLLMVTASLALFVMSKSNNPAAERLRAVLSDTVVPVLEFAASPFNAVASAGAWISGMVQLNAENIALKNQNLQLLKWQTAAKDMEEENRALRALLKVVPSQAHEYVTVRIVSDLGGPYIHSALINGGEENGVAKDQPVINESGLVGRVVEAGKTSARVLMLGDINSRVPVMAETSREKSIMVGNNDNLPSLSYLAVDSKITAGERIVTSGDGGVFPAGIPVGIVASVDKGTVRIQPFVDPSRIEYVSAMRYSF